MSGAVSPPSDALQRGREAYAEKAWQDAYERLARADAEAALAAHDLQLLATTAYMLGRMSEFLELVERAHHKYLDEGDARAAIRAAIYLGINLSIQGEMARASGWFGRAQRMLEREEQECAEHAYLLLPGAMQQLMMGNYADAQAIAASAAEAGERFRNPDLLALALHIEGQALIKLARTPEGLGRLDEAMLAATSPDISPFITGVVYCGVIAGCEKRTAS